MDDITSSIRLLHSKNISHGDINPLNITIHNHNGRHRAFIIDFGETKKNTRDFFTDAENTINCIKIIGRYIKNDSIRENIQRISIKSTFDKLINTLNELNEDDDPEAGLRELLARGAPLVGEPSSPPGSPVRSMQLFNSTPKRLRMSSP
jgi:serine/threonine protein kinase